MASRAELGRKLDSALLHLACNNRYLAVELYRLGEVRLTDQVPTAAIARRGERLQYLWNPEFLAKLDRDQVAFVCMHEAMHVACEHLYRVPSQATQKGWNIATDCVINDFLLSKFSGFLKPIEGILRGPDIVGKLVADKTAEAVFEMLVEQAKEQEGLDTLDDHSGWGEAGEGDGSPEDAVQSEQFKARIRGTIRRAAIREMEATKQAGNFPAGVEIEITATRSKYDWKRLLAQFLASRVSFNPSWKIRRKTTLHLPPDPYLPGVAKEHDGWTVALMVDTSGSMSADLEFIISRLKALPPQVEVRCAWFDTEVYETTLDDMKEGKTQGHGGTTFTPPIEWAQSLPNPPDVNILITDGYAFDNYAVREPRKWLWLVTPGGQMIRNNGVCVQM